MDYNGNPLLLSYDDAVDACENFMGSEISGLSRWSIPSSGTWYSLFYEGYA